MYNAYVTGCSIQLRALYEKYGGRFPKIAFGNYWRSVIMDKPKFFVQPDSQCSTPTPAGVRVIKYRSLDATMNEILIRVYPDKYGYRLFNAEQLQANTECTHKGTNMLVNLKGLTAAGKSSVVFSLIRPYLQCNCTRAEDWPVLVKGTSPGVKHTYLPALNLLVFGTYFSGSGGCDAFTKEQMMTELRTFWDCGCDILYEGVIVSDTVVTYMEFAQSLNAEHTRKRVHAYVFLHVSIDEARRRLLIRNTTGELKDKYLDRKWSKYKYMPTQYLEWADDDERMEVYLVEARKGVRYSTQVLRYILSGHWTPRECVSPEFSNDHNQLAQYFSTFKRKTSRTGDDLLKLSRKRSAQEDVRVHGRKIDV